MDEPLEFDGERFTPENVREIWYEHMHRYAFASRLVAGLEVLDAACGEGYGSSILARRAASVTGVDNAGRAVDHARRRYTGANLEYLQADCAALPFDDARFDCIVSFETIEHLEAQSQMLAEFRRVLRPDGFLLISSPDKAIYSDARNYDNPHHVRELYREEFMALLAGQFPAVRLLGQKLMFHSVIWSIGSGGEGQAATPRAFLQTVSGGDLRELAQPGQEAMYLLAVCGSAEESLPRLDNGLWLFDDSVESVYAHYQHEIRKNMQAGKILAERDRELEQAKAALADRGSQSGGRKTWLSRILDSWRR